MPLNLAVLLPLDFYFVPFWFFGFPTDNMLKAMSESAPAATEPKCHLSSPYILRFPTGQCSQAAMAAKNSAITVLCFKDNYKQLASKFFILNPTLQAAAKPLPEAQLQLEVRSWYISISGRKETPMKILSVQGAYSL